MRSGYVFTDNAPAYWSKHLSVVPIEPRTKEPSKGVESWSSYCTNLPNARTRERWIRCFPDHGIGLLLGKQVHGTLRICAIDVDDDALVEVTRAALGETPCAKRGKKGITFFAVADDSIKSTQLRDGHKQGKIDILCNGKMTVLPPTLHKDTGLPYVWVGTPLLECDFGTLPIISIRTIEILRRIVASEHTATLAGGRSTHDAGVALSASLVQAGCDDTEIERIIRSTLPANYEGNSLDELAGWVASARAKGFGNSNRLPPDERVAQLIEREMEPLAYLPGQGLLHYGDGHWRGVSEVMIDRRIKTLLIEQSDKGAVAPRIMNVRKCLTLNVLWEKFAGDPNLICCLNGTLDITRGELIPWSPSHRL